MVKPLGRLLFVFFVLCLTSPASAQSNLTRLYYGCVQQAFNENWTCTRWAPTTGTPPAYPEYGYESLGFIFPPPNQPSGTLSLYYGCMQQAWNGSEMGCVKWDVMTSPPPYGSTVVGYIYPTSVQPAGAVPIYYGCVQQAFNGEWTCTKSALSKTSPPYGGDKLGHVYSYDDTCSRAGLSMCVRFEAAPDTQFGGVNGPTTVTSQNMGSALSWQVENAGGDSATDTDRIARITMGSDARDESSVIRFQTLSNDIGVHDSQEFERSEMALLNTTTEASEGTEQWWAHSLFVPLDSNLPNDTGTQMGVFQFHGTPSDDPARNQPNFILQIRNQEGPNPHKVFRAYSAGAAPYASGRTDGTQYTYNITNGPTNLIGQCIYDSFEKGVWYDFVHHIRWSYNNNGIHEIWMRKRSDGQVTKVLQKGGINTLYSGDTAYLKIGLYHEPVAGLNTSVIHDRIRRGQSLDAVRMPDFTVDLNASAVLCPGTTPN